MMRTIRPFRAEPETKPNPLVENAELWLKVGSAILGILYVLGLLISNLQLMDLGIADFSSLHVRNIMTGFLFLAYVLLLLVALSPVLIPMVLWKPVITELSKGLRIWFLYFAVLWGIACFYSVGTWLGYFYPWGKGWEKFPVLWSFDWAVIKLNVLRVFTQFLDAYQYPKAIWASVFIILMVAMYLTIRSARNRLIDFVFVFYFSIPTALLLVSFAEDVYPNMRYNLGGGQPQVAELQVREDKETITGLPGLTVYGSNKQNQILGTEPLAIWYMSDKFLYVSPLPHGGQGTAQTVAIDIEMIRTIHYIRKYVKVGSGGRIISVGSY